MLWELVRCYHLTHGTLETCFTITTVKPLHQQKVNHSCWNLDVFGILIFLFCINKSYNLEESLSELCLSVVFQYYNTTEIKSGNDAVSTVHSSIDLVLVRSRSGEVSLKGFDLIDVL